MEPLKKDIYTVVIGLVIIFLMLAVVVRDPAWVIVLLIFFGSLMMVAVGAYQEAQKKRGAP